MKRRSKKTPKELGTQHQSAQDDSREGGEVTKSSAQDGRKATPLQTHMPGLEALRARDMSSHDHSAQRPVRPASLGQRHLRQALWHRQLEIPARKRKGADIAAAAPWQERQRRVSLKVPVQPQGHDQRMLVEEPWHHVRYQAPFRGQDRWSMELWNDGWLLRFHPRCRKQLFAPVHASMPVNGHQLTTERVTLMTFENHGSEKIAMDRWDEPRRWKSGCMWKGITFLKRKVTSARAVARSKPKGEMAIEPS